MKTCALETCDAEIPESHANTTTPQMYCKRTHKVKASKRRTTSTPEKALEHIQKSSGYYFAKFMDGAERIAEIHNVSQSAAKDAMVNAIADRISKYRMEMDA